MKLSLFFLPSLMIAQGNFQVGFSAYSGSWATYTYSGSGNNINLVDALQTSLGPIGLITYTYNVVNNNNPPNTASTLSQVSFYSQNPSLTNLYGTNNTLTNFNQTTAQGITSVSFTELNSTNNRMLNMTLNTSTGQFVNQVSQVIPYQTLSVTSTNLTAYSSNQYSAHYFLGPNKQGNYILNNVKGNGSQFNQAPYNPTAALSLPSHFVVAATGSFISPAFSQSNYGISSIQYYKQTYKNNYQTKPISDNAQQSVNFLLYDDNLGNLFYGDNSSYGTRLAMSQYLSTGDFKNPNLLIGNYDYNSSTGVSMNTDPQNVTYLTWNGSTATYIGAFDNTNNSWQGLFPAPSSFFSSSLPNTTPYSAGLFLTQVVTSNNTYNIQNSLFNNTTFSYGTQTTINQTYGTYSSIGTQGTVSGFSQAPSSVSAVDNNGNIVTVFSGKLASISSTSGTYSTSSYYQIFFNVFNSSKETFSGMISLPYPISLSSSTLSGISAPYLVSYSGNIAIVFYANYSGTYTIYGAIYSPSSMSFGTPTQISGTFSSAPQIMQAPGYFGFIYAGSN